MALDVYTSTGARLTSPQLPTYVTSLPSGPIDGQEIYYAADATNGVIWHLRYRSASSSSYKWEFVGGAPMNATGSGSDSYSSSTYGTSGTPSVTVPLAGDYVFTIRAYIISVGAGVNNMVITLHDDGVATGVEARLVSSGQYDGGSVTQVVQLNAVGASSVMNLRYKTINSIETAFNALGVFATPVRVG